MSHGILNPSAIAAKDVDAWQRFAKGAVDFDNGDVFYFSGRSVVSGEGEVWNAVVPASSGSHLTGVWMAYEPELPWTGSYRGLTPDVREFYNPAGKVFTAFMPKLGDILVMSADCFTGAKGASNAYANCTDGQKKLVWGDSQTGSVFSLKYHATEWFSLATGAMDNQRITAYLMEVVGL